ncbi:MAG: small ribosomal subunit Rsm22 family protein [Beijerinckiaceae bacterium]
MPGLPPALQQALSALSSGKGRSTLAQRSSSITAGYQKRQNSRHILVNGDDALAYALARMPATYAATRRALLRLAEAAPMLAPASLLDIGCGPGTASFAASDVFADLQAFCLLDRNGPFLDLARTLAPELAAGAPADASIDVAAHELSDLQPLPKADLVIAGYVLAELDEGLRQALVPRLWEATAKALVLVEPGTPDGFLRLREARYALIAAGAHVAAPCTHASACPMSGENWCRFFERVQRSRDHRMLKGGTLSFEDEPYAYLAVMREAPAGRPASRIVGRPVVSKVQAQIPVCGAHGLFTLSVPSRQKTLFKDFKRLEWGDAVVNPIQEAVAVNQDMRETVLKS